MGHEEEAALLQVPESAVGHVEPPEAGQVVTGQLPRALALHPTVLPQCQLPHLCSVAIFSVIKYFLA